MCEVKNWAGNIKFDPHKVEYPSSVEAMQKVVIDAANDRRKVRMIGSGHSFTPLIQTNDVVVSLDNYQGLISVDQDKCQATVKGGTKLNVLGQLLFAEGLAMENLGDIDVQSIAGTISTGTHGTGQEFGTISTQVVALEFVNGKGNLVKCSESENRELFKAAQVSLGTLGVITQVTLQCVPSYKLALQNRKEKVEAVFANLNERNDQNRNFEFYWFPYTDTAWTKTSNIVEAYEPDKVNILNFWSEYVIENYAFKLICEYAAMFPSKNEFVAKLSANTVTDVKKVFHSHKIYATQRMVKFREMEYNVPREAYEDVWKDITKAVNTKKFNVHFPIENRFVKGDDIFMSPAYQRDSAYLACHVYAKKDCTPYFTALEEIFRAYGGRPHWGKMNTLRPNDISDLYPEFDTFMRYRAQQDPNNIFLSRYLQQLLGISD